MAATIDQPYFEVFAYEGLLSKRPTETHRLRTMPGECLKWIRFVGDKSEPFDVSGELMQETARLPWELIVLGYNLERDCYRVKLGDLKIDWSLFNEN